MALSLPTDLRTLYLEVLKHPTLIEEISSYQKSKLREYVEQESMKLRHMAAAMMIGNPDYPYPDEYRNGREEEYLLVTHLSAYWRGSQNVLQMLAEKPVAATALASQHKAKRNPDQLTVDELALLCVYTRKCITDENAKEYLEGELKSGRALYNRFTHYSSPSNRTGFGDGTAKRRNNMIARIQKVLPRLNDEQKKRADNEIHTLTAQNQ